MIAYPSKAAQKFLYVNNHSSYRKSTCDWRIVILIRTVIVSTIEVDRLSSVWKEQNLFHQKADRNASNIINLLESSNARQGSSTLYY